MPIIRPEQEAIKNILMYVPRRTGARNPRRGGGGGGGFTPPTGLLAWYDVQDASTLTLNGNLLERIADKSGNGFDMIGYNAFGGGDGGYYDDSSTFAGFKSLRYTATAGQPGYANFCYTENEFFASGKNLRTTFIVAAPYQPGASGGLVSLKGSTGSTVTVDRIFAPIFNNMVGELYGWNGATRLTTTTSYSSLPGMPLIYGIREQYAGISQREAYSSDPTLVVSTISNSRNMNYKYMAWGRTSSGQNIGSGEVLEVLQWDSILSDDDFNLVISYLRGKYGF